MPFDVFGIKNVAMKFLTYNGKLIRWVFTKKHIRSFVRSYNEKNTDIIGHLGLFTYNEKCNAILIFFTFSIERK